MPHLADTLATGTVALPRWRRQAPVAASELYRVLSYPKKRPNHGTLDRRTARGSECSTFQRHKQLVDLNAKGGRQPLEVVQGDISGLAFNMGNERPVQTSLERERLLRPTFRSP